jgi:hypothetical protein
MGWAAWHPKKGFDVPYRYEGAIVYADLSPSLLRLVQDLNAEDGTTNRTGWRASKVLIAKVAS